MRLVGVVRCVVGRDRNKNEKDKKGKEVEEREEKKEKGVGGGVEAVGASVEGKK